MLFRQFFISFPSELEEAAFLDGAGHFRIFWQIALPLARPMIGASAVFSFLFAWNDFLWPLIVSTSPDMMTVQVGLSVFSGRYGTFWTLLAAASVVVCLPAILAFSLAQRQFAQAVTYSGLKE
jgi:multiple sugar transport system permease protein